MTQNQTTSPGSQASGGSSISGATNASVPGTPSGQTGRQGLLSPIQNLGGMLQSLSGNRSGGGTGGSGGGNNNNSAPIPPVNNPGINNNNQPLPPVNNNNNPPPPGGNGGGGSGGNGGGGSGGNGGNGGGGGPPQPPKPIMGELVWINHRDGYVVKMHSGKPLPDWSGVENPARCPNNAGCYRTADPKYAQSQEETRCKAGDGAAFKEGCDMAVIGAEQDDHFRKFGFTPLSYLPDPDDSTLMRNIHTDFMRYDLDSLRSSVALIKNKYDQYDWRGVHECRDRLLKVMDDTFRNNFRLNLEPGELEEFTYVELYWLCWNRAAQTRPSNQRDTLINIIKSCSADRVGKDIIKGRNMILWASKVRPVIRQIISAGGQFPYELLLKLAHVADKALPSSNHAAVRIYHDSMLALIKALDETLLQVTPMVDENAKRRKFRDKGLWYDTLLTSITTAYEKCRDGGGWSPGSGPTDSKTPGGHGLTSTQVNQVVAEAAATLGVSATEVNKLMFDSQAGGKKSSNNKGNGSNNGSGSSGKSRSCFGCGADDHFLRDCPNRNKGGGGSSGGSGGNANSGTSNRSNNSNNRSGNNSNKRNGGQGNRSNNRNNGNGGGNGNNSGNGGSVRTTPPGPNDDWTKMINGKLHNWCPKCGKSGKFVDNHTAEEHIGRGNGYDGPLTPAQANMASVSTGNDMGLVEDPAAWYCPMVDPSPQPTLSLVLESVMAWFKSFGMKAMGCVFGTGFWLYGWFSYLVWLTTSTMFNAWLLFCGLVFPAGALLSSYDDCEGTMLHHTKLGLLIVFNLLSWWTVFKYGWWRVPFVTYPAPDTRTPEEIAAEEGFKKKVRKRWERLLTRKKKRKRQRRPQAGSVRDHGFSKHYPRQLRAQGLYYNKKHMPSLARQNNHDRFLKMRHVVDRNATRSMNAAADSYHTRVPRRPRQHNDHDVDPWIHTCYTSRSTPTNADRDLNWRSKRNRRKPKPRPRRPYERPYGPAPCFDGVHSPTMPRRAAAGRLQRHVNLGMVDQNANPATLRMAFNAPISFRRKPRGGPRGMSLRQASSSFKVCFDSGCSIAITNDKRDFVGGIRSSFVHRLTGLAHGLKIQGQGVVMWSFLDTNGNFRHIKVPAYYVPDAKCRLIGTTSLLEQYPDEEIKLCGTHLELSGVDHDPTRGTIQVPYEPRNKLPMADGYRFEVDERCDDIEANLLGAENVPTAADEMMACANVVEASNSNLSETEKEWLKWHFRLGHPGADRLRFLMRSQVLAHSEETRSLHRACANLRHPPKCAACLYGKQTCRSNPAAVSHQVQDRAGLTKQEALKPGQRVFVDHFVSSAKGRLFGSKGKTPEDDMYCGGAIFYDAASQLIRVEFQSSLNTHQTLAAKDCFEQYARDHGVIPTQYVFDNGTAFTSSEFAQRLSSFEQTSRRAAPGAHHHNPAERAIRTVTSIARTMMIHAAIHWPEMSDHRLWPMAVNHAVYLYNHLPNPRTGLAPIDIFTRSRWEQRKLHDLHVWGCPTYQLDKSLADKKKIPRWQPRSKRTVHVGLSDRHVSTTPLVLNPDTGTITAQFHVVFDDWFATVSSDDGNMPDFNSPEWSNLFGDELSCFDCFHDDDDDDLSVDLPASDLQTWRETSVAAAMDRHDIAAGRKRSLSPPPSVSPSSVQREHDSSVSSPPAKRPALEREQSHGVIPGFSPAVVRPPSRSPSPDPSRLPTIVVPPAPATSPQREKRVRFKDNEASQQSQSEELPASMPSSNDTESTTTPSSESPAPAIRYPKRQRRQVSRMDPDPTQKSYDSLYAAAPSFHCYYNEAPLFKGDRPFHQDMTLVHPLALKATVSDPDLFSYEQAMRSPERDEWIEAAKKEIEGLEGLGAWVEVPMSEADGKIIPMLWAFKVKRTSGGEVIKKKARLCVMGNHMDTPKTDTFAPVVAWSTVRMFLVLSSILGWQTQGIDFSQAFVQAKLKTPIFCHLPRGFRSQKGSGHCLRLIRSVYGTTVAPRLFFELLAEALTNCGFKQSKYDQCLWYMEGLMVVQYVDDLGASFLHESTFLKVKKQLKDRGFNFTEEDTFSEFLGINLKEGADGSITMTQKGLIDKILKATDMVDCNPNWTPAPRDPIGLDPDGEPYDETWDYASVVGMLIYLSTNTRLDIAHAVSQVARFTHHPKKSHATAVKTIIRYLKGTKNKGTIFTPTKKLDLNLYVDASFAPLYKFDPDIEPSSAKSRLGWVIFLAGCPLIWKSQLQQDIATSSAESEYSALSLALKMLIPLRNMLIEACDELGLPPDFKATVSARAFEDNAAAEQLAVEQRLTSRTRYYHIKWHWFWDKVKRSGNPNGFVEILRVDTHNQIADFLTKQPSREVFEKLRKMAIGW